MFFYKKTIFFPLSLNFLNISLEIKPREVRNDKNAVKQTKHLSLFEHKYNGCNSSRKTIDQDTIPTKPTKTTDSQSK